MSNEEWVLSPNYRQIEGVALSIVVDAAKTKLFLLEMNHKEQLATIEPHPDRRSRFLWSLWDEDDFRHETKSLTRRESWRKLQEIGFDGYFIIENIFPPPKTKTERRAGNRNRRLQA